MIVRAIELRGRHRFVVFGTVFALVIWALWTIRNTPLHAVPDLSDPQVIVFTEWMGRSPDLVEDQITYPLVRALQSTPGGVKTVRGYSMFGMSFIYVIFGEGTDVVEGAAQRVRPKLMTVAAAVLALLPLLWSAGVGADVTARTAAPLIGGLAASTFVTLFVTPSLYAIWRHWQFRRLGHVTSPGAPPSPTHG